LAYARGTDRNVSFCQFVVRDGVPFEVEDAEIDPRVPKHLVKNYSIRSYLGVPIKANDTIIGSLCVIDTKPRKFSPEEKDKLDKLAKSVNKRLAILSEHRRKPDMTRSQQNRSNAVDELERSLYPIEEDILVGRSSHTAISAFLRLVEYNGSSLPPLKLTTV
ncbi:MAG TPA: GAF domain-containing protein, partial [Phaeodactylibacter sp.]|nr:GAF domain-containing protein [Phaeodactylibacter sp.]